MSSLSSLEDLNCTDSDCELDSSVGSVFLPLQPCSKRKNRDPVDIGDAVGGSCAFREVKSAKKAVVVAGELHFCLSLSFLLGCDGFRFLLLFKKWKCHIFCCLIGIRGLVSGFRWVFVFSHLFRW